jgi:alkylated DNA repair dioxygenase AlkB
MGQNAPPATQLGLFDSEQTAVDTSFAAAHRIALDETSWIEHVPGWLSGGAAVLDELRDTAPWEQRERWMYDRRVTEPRMTAEYRDLAAAPQTVLHTIAAALSGHYGVRYDGLWMNFYRDHQDGTGWHADRPVSQAESAIVPVLSLGAQRRFLIRPAGGGRSTIIQPMGGDLVVMGGRCQRDWQHCVPKQKTLAGPRISLNFTSREQTAPASG